MGLSQLYAADDKVTIPKDDNWEETDDRNYGSPQLYQDNSSVYVYSEKAVGQSDHRHYWHDGEYVSLRGDYRPGLYVIRLFAIFVESVTV